MKNDANRDELITFARSILQTFNGQVVPENGDVYSSCEHMVNYYEHLLKEGVSPEQARMILPQNMMTEWIWSGTLGAWCDMLRLRLDPHTQYESRIVAPGVREIIEPLFPVSVKGAIE